MNSLQQTHEIRLRGLEGVVQGRVECAWPASHPSDCGRPRRSDCGRPRRSDAAGPVGAIEIAATTSRCPPSRTRRILTSFIIR